MRHALARLRTVLPTLALLCSVGQAAAQETEISGRVVDAADGAPLPFATLLIRSAEAGDTVSATLTGPDGRFVVAGLPPGTYSLQAGLIGYFTDERSLLVSELNDTYDLGEIRLARLAETEGLTVTAEAVRAAGIDTQLFRLDEGAGQTTGSVLDAMRNLPGVTVDQDGRVSLRGSDQVAVLIDGRQSSLTGFGSQRGLDNVSAANVESIEIIYNPSASFDAAGSAGIINIVYKENRDPGLATEVGMSVGVGQLTKQRADLPTDLGSYSTNPKITPSLSLSYNTDAARFFAQGDFTAQEDLPNNEFTTRYYDDARTIESQVPENREQTHYIIRLGTDVFLDASSTLTLSGIYDLETHTDRAQVPFILQSTGERERFWFWREKETTGFANVSANWRHEFQTPGHELELDLQYTRGWEDESYFLNEVSRVREGTDMTHLEAEENTLPLSIAYTRPLASGRLELGARLQRRWIPITYDVDRGVGSVIYEGLGDYSDWDEDILALYGNLVRVRDAYTLEAGLRMERTDVSYTIPSENIYYEGSDAYDYLELFPNLKATVGLGRGVRLIAAYNRRIDRPGEPELRIFPKYDDPELLKVGNPFLRPQLTNVFELGLAKGQDRWSLSFSAYHRDVSDAFQRVFAIDDSDPDYDIVNRIYENAGNSRQTGVQLVASQQVGSSWQLSESFNWFTNEVDRLETTLLFPTARPFVLDGSSDDTWEFTLDNLLALPGSSEARFSYIYYAARNVPQGRERARSSIDVALTWPLFGERGEAVFTATDLLNDFAVVREIDGQGFTALYENLRETQVVRVGVRLRF